LIVIPEVCIERTLPLLFTVAVPPFLRETVCPSDPAMVCAGTICADGVCVDGRALVASVAEVGVVWPVELNPETLEAVPVEPCAVFLGMALACLGALACT